MSWPLNRWCDVLRFHGEQWHTQHPVDMAFIFLLWPLTHCQTSTAGHGSPSDPGSWPGILASATEFPRGPIKCLIWSALTSWCPGAFTVSSGLDLSSHLGFQTPLVNPRCSSFPLWLWSRPVISAQASETPAVTALIWQPLLPSPAPSHHHG